MKQTVLLRGRSKSSLQDGALVRLLVSLGQESGPGGGLEDLTDTIVGSCGALEVLVGTDLLGDVLALGRRLAPASIAVTLGRAVPYLLLADGGLRGLGELLNHLSVVAEIDLASNENDGETLAEVKDFGNPLERVGYPLAICLFGGEVWVVHRYNPMEGSPSPGRCQESQGNRWRSKSG